MELLSHWVCIRGREGVDFNIENRWRSKSPPRALERPAC
jgi:hypothetical protein